MVKYFKNFYIFRSYSKFVYGMHILKIRRVTLISVGRFHDASLWLLTVVLLYAVGGMTRQ